MKWTISYSNFYCIGKGEPCSDNKIIGYSNLEEQNLFKKLEKEYPNLPILKKINSSYEYDYTLYDKNGNEKYLPFRDYVYFEANILKKF